MLLLIMLGDELAVEQVWQLREPMLKGHQGQHLWVWLHTERVFIGPYWCGGGIAQG